MAVAKRVVLVVGSVLVGAFLVIQLVPYGWHHDNPPVVSDAPWPTAEAAAIARESCYDCHSNETHWPWYSYVAPVSWLVRKDVVDGRAELNFSDWPGFAGKADDAIDEISDGRMPLDKYLRLHPDAELSPDEVVVLVQALSAMGDDGGGGSNRGPGGGGSGRG